MTALDSVCEDLVSSGELSGVSITTLEKHGKANYASAGLDAVGLPLTGNSSVSLFCIVKLLIARAIWCAVESGELSYDDRLGDLVEVRSPLSNAQIVHLLEHRSGLIGPQGVNAGLLDRQARRRLIGEGTTLQPGTETHYSEVLGFEALAMALEAATERSVAELINLPGIYFTANGRSDLGTVVTLGISPSDPDAHSFPILFDTSSNALSDPNPGFGAVVQPTAFLRSMSEWVEAAVRSDEWSNTDGVRGMRFDHTFGRKVDWRLGLCASLRSELKCSLDGTLVGHLGLLSGSLYVHHIESGVSSMIVTTPLSIAVDQRRSMLGAIVDQVFDGASDSTEV